MKKIILLTLLLTSLNLCFGQTAQNKQSGQSRPNFSGTWRLSKYEITPGNQPFDISITMVISHLEPEIRISRKVMESGKEHNQEWIYYSDGRGEGNVLDWDDLTSVKSKTKWNNGRLVSKASIDVSEKVITNQKTQDKYTEDRVEEWELSSDGKTLIHITRMSIHPDKYNGASILTIKITRTYIRIS